MARIPLVQEDGPATPASAAEFLRGAFAARGRLSNVTRAMANNPGSARAFLVFSTAVYGTGSTLKRGHAELAYLTATVANNCYY